MGWFKTDAAAVDQQASKGGRTRYVGKEPLWKQPEGDSTVRFLPAWRKGMSFAYPVGLHYDITDGDAPYCPRVSRVGKCLMCRKGFRLKDGEDAREQQKGKDLMPARYFLVSVALRKDEGVWVVRRWLAPAGAMEEDVFPLWKNSNYGDVTDPKDGFNFTVNKRGKGRKTKYKFTPIPRPKPLVSIKLLDRVIELDALITFPDLTEQKRLLRDWLESGVEADEEEAELEEGEEEGTVAEEEEATGAEPAAEGGEKTDTVEETGEEAEEEETEAEERGEVEETEEEETEEEEESEEPAGEPEPKADRATEPARAAVSTLRKQREAERAKVGSVKKPQQTHKPGHRRR